MHRPTHCLRRAVFPALLGLVLSPVWADPPESHNFPGGLSLIPVGKQAQKPDVFFGMDPVLVIPKEDEWLAVVGLPMNIIPGKYALRIEPVTEADPERKMLTFTIYPLHAKYKQRSFALPAAFTAEQFAAHDNQKLRAMFATSSPKSGHAFPDFNFQHVVLDGNFLPFGRIVSKSNDRDTSLQDHPKIAYLAAKGTIARAPSSGIVENILYPDTSEQTVVIRHSQHFRSILSYLSNSPLEAGESVEAGQPIGTVSMPESIDKGRIDWYLMLNGVEVDPLLMINSSQREK